MNLSTLQAHGVTAAYSGSRLFLHGLDRLNPAEATQIVEMVRKDKFRLLVELAEAGRKWVCLDYWRGCSKCEHYNGSSFPNWCGRGYRPQLPPKKEHDSHHRRITPAMVKNYRVACPWLLERLDVLRGAGWTLKALFGVSRLRWPYLWGVGWSSAWTSPGWTPALTPEGHIRWRIEEPRRTVYQTSRPGH